MQFPYPIKFTPIFKEKLWGGNKIKTIIGKDYGNLTNAGESWEISGVDGDISIVANGPLAGKSLPQIIEEFKGELLGEQVYQQFETEFPLLIKFIDANDDLSVQVHPDDEVALKRHNCFGKTEMWYVVQADPGARLVSGFSKPVTKESFGEAFNAGRLMEVLNHIGVNAGDVFFLPAGRVHYIGKGVMIAEIQQTSDITYRVYDFDRADSEGKKRELHIEQALEAIDYQYQENYRTDYQLGQNDEVNLVSCPYFSTNLMAFDQPVERNYSGHDTFVIYMCVEGSSQLMWGSETMEIRFGDTLLIPASLKTLSFNPVKPTKILEVMIDL